MIMVNVLSALQTVPEEQFEAAKIDGASSWQVFKFIVFPHIKVVVGLLVVLRTVWIFNNFDIIYLLRVVDRLMLQRRFQFCLQPGLGH